MRLLLAFLAATLVSGVAAVSLSSLAAVRTAVLRSLPDDLAQQSPCIVETAKSASPDTLLRGEVSTVTLKVTARCAGAGEARLHVVLVLDASSSMAGAHSAQMKDAALTLVKNLDMAQHPATEVGVVEFNDQARTLLELTNAEDMVLRAIRQVGAAGGSAIDLGIRAGLEVLLRGRAGRGQVGSDVREVMIVVSDGGNNSGCPPLLQAARQAKELGVLLVTVCVGAGCDAQCMRQAASGPRYFFQALDVAGLSAILESLRGDADAVRVRALTVTDTLPVNMEHIASSARPRPEIDRQSLVRWRAGTVPGGGLTLTLAVRPKEPGRHSTNLLAHGVFTDSLGRTGLFTFPVPYVTVLQARPPVPTATATVAASPTPPSRALFLPVNYSGALP